MRSTSTMHSMPIPAHFTDRLPLVLQLARRDVAGRYRGSLLGLSWSFFQPLLLLAVYTFVFGLVFKSRWSHDQSRFGFALTLFCGLVVYNLFAECITRAPSLVLAHASYVKKVVFPLDILPWVSLSAALFHAFASLAVLFVFLVLFGPGLSPSALLLPLVLLPLLPMILGLSWLLASIGVYLRDIGQVVNLSMTVLLFMSPVFYPASGLPPAVRPWLFLNPLTLIIEETRKVLIEGIPPDWGSLLVYLAVALLVAQGGHLWFQKTRKGFADVL